MVNLYEEREKHVQTVLNVIPKNTLMVEYTLCIIKNDSLKSVIPIVKKHLNEVTQHDDVYLSMVYDFTNNHLDEILTALGYKFFVPLCIPTYDMKENTFEIYYYHDEDSYNSMYKKDNEKQFIVNVSQELKTHYEELYIVYHGMQPSFI